MNTKAATDVFQSFEDSIEKIEDYFTTKTYVFLYTLLSNLRQLQGVKISLFIFHSTVTVHIRLQ